MEESLRGTEPSEVRELKQLREESRPSPFVEPTSRVLIPPASSDAEYLGVRAC